MLTQTFLFHRDTATDNGLSPGAPHHEVASLWVPSAPYATITISDPNDPLDQYGHNITLAAGSNPVRFSISSSATIGFTLGGGGYVCDDPVTTAYPVTIAFGDYAQGKIQEAQDNRWDAYFDCTFAAPPVNGTFYISCFVGGYLSTKGSGFGTGGTTPPVALSVSLGLDAHRRPLAVIPGGAALVASYSNDAGHTFLAGGLGPNSTANADPSLLVDTRQNTYRVVCAGPSGLSQHFGSLQDGYVEDAASPAALAGPAGNAASFVNSASLKYPAAAPHPTDRDFALLAYLDGSTLKTAWSGDAGASWNALATVQAALDLSLSGRPALCWLGEAAFLAASVGAVLGVRASLDRGLTWAAPVTVATAPANANYSAVAFSGLSLLGWQGKLYLLGWGVGAAGTTLSPSLWVSGDLGRTWAASVGTLPPALTAPSAVSVLPRLGQHRLGITHASLDDGGSWILD